MKEAKDWVKEHHSYQDESTQDELESAFEAGAKHLKQENALMHQVVIEFNSVFEFQWKKIIATVSRKYQRRVFSMKVEAAIMFEIRGVLSDFYPPAFVAMLSVSINRFNKVITIKMKGN